MGVARAGDRALPPRTSRTVLRRHEAHVGHQLPRILKAFEISQFRGQHHRAHQAYAAQSLQRADQRRERRGLHQLRDVSSQPRHALCLPLHLVQRIGQHAPLRLVGEGLLANPGQVRLGPGSAAPTTVVPQQELAQPVPRRPLRAPRVFASPLQVAQGLGGFVRRPDRRQVARSQEVGQLGRIAAIGLDPLPRPLRHQRRRTTWQA